MGAQKHAGYIHRPCQGFEIFTLEVDRLIAFVPRKEVEGGAVHVGAATPYCHCAESATNLGGAVLVTRKQ